MRRKEQYADEIIKMLERTKVGAWASNINLNTKDRVIEVCQNCVDSWSGRKFKDHCTTPPQALEQTMWIPVSDKYEHHVDHTDCIWYGNDSGCPTTCSQYRDGWNDAMDYIFKNGDGYRPYRRE